MEIGFHVHSLAQWRTTYTARSDFPIQFAGSLLKSQNLTNGLDSLPHPRSWSHFPAKQQIGWHLVLRKGVPSAGLDSRASEWKRYSARTSALNRNAQSKSYSSSKNEIRVVSGTPSHPWVPLPDFVIFYNHISLSLRNVFVSPAVVWKSRASSRGNWLTTWGEKGEERGTEGCQRTTVNTLENNKRQKHAFNLF